MKFELETIVTVKKNYNIISFEILSINIKPNISAQLEIMFYCDDDKLYSRQYLLIDKEYSDWSTDDYLPYIIKLNLEKIFNN